MNSRLSPLLIGFALALGAATTAQGATTVTDAGALPVDMGLAGEALIALPDELSGGTIAPVRILPGQPPQAIPVTGAQVPGSSEGSIYAGRVSASAGAVAITADLTGPGATRVFVGPPTGPLRLAASCPEVDEPLPVAADGTRVAYVDGGCDARGETTAATVVVADADPAVPARRFALPPKVLPLGLSLGAGGDRVSFETEDRGKVVAALLPDGTLAPSTAPDTEYGFELLGTTQDGATLIGDLPDYQDAAGCNYHVRRLTPGVPTLPTFPSAGCLTGGVLDEAFGQTRGVTRAGDRLLSLAIAKGSTAATPATRLLSAPVSGAPATTLLSMGGRRPFLLTGDATRIAYAVQPCTADEDEGPAQLVVTDTAGATLRECGSEVTGTTLRREGKRTGSIAVTCPIGCVTRTTILGPGKKGPGEGDSVQRGSFRADVALPARVKAGTRVRVRIEVFGGRTVERTFRVVAR